MAITFTIGGTSYTALNSSTGRKAVFIRVAAPVYDIKRFHIPGVDGNLIIRGGISGGNIICMMRYVDALATALLNYRTDRELFAKQENTIVDDEGRTNNRCNLIAMSRETEPDVIDATSNIWFDVTAVFIVDGGPSVS